MRPARSTTKATHRTRRVRSLGRPVAVGLALAVCLASLGDPARAQRRRGRQAAAPTASEASEEAPPSIEVEVARRLFQEGMLAIEQGLWLEALTSFRGAYELTRAPSALQNVAIALRALGRHREARDAFATLLREHALDPDTRREITALRDEVMASLATLEIAGLERHPDARLRLDGSPIVDDGTRPLRLSLDPSAHALVAELAGHEPFFWEGTLGGGARTQIELEFLPLARSDDTALHVTLVVGGVVLAALVAGLVGFIVWDEGRVQPSYETRLSP